MRKNNISRIVVFGFLVVSMVTTSFGGAFATSALAATGDSAQEKSSSDKGLVSGVIALGLLALLGGHGGHNSATDTASTPKSSTSSSSNSTPASTSSSNIAAAESKALALLNADRAANGLPALKLNTKLTKLGESYAQDMIKRNFFSHNNPEGQTPFDRMHNAGISYSYAGENLAINSNVQAAETAFMNSPGHRANILSPNYSEVGIGVALDAKGMAYVVQEFIKP